MNPEILNKHYDYFLKELLIYYTSYSRTKCNIKNYSKYFIERRHSPLFEG